MATVEIRILLIKDVIIMMEKIIQHMLLEGGNLDWNFQHLLLYNVNYILYYVYLHSTQFFHKNKAHHESIRNYNCPHNGTGYAAASILLIENILLSLFCALFCFLLKKR